MMRRPSSRLLRSLFRAGLLALLGCSRTPPADTTPGGLETLALRYEGSPGNVTIQELAEDLVFLAPLRLDYKGNMGRANSLARRSPSTRWALTRSSRCATTSRGAG
jgi:hypothetical protein